MEEGKLMVSTEQVLNTTLPGFDGYGYCVVDKTYFGCVRHRYQKSGAYYTIWVVCSECDEMLLHDREDRKEDRNELRKRWEAWTNR